MIWRTLLRTVLSATAIGSLLVACGAEAPVPYEAPAVEAPTSAAPEPEVVADPTAITIPAIGAHSTLVPLGLTATGELDVPPVDQPMQAAWYAGAKPDVAGDEYQPGEPGGPAIVSGHVDGVIDGVKGRPGIFHRLSELKPGDEILIDRDEQPQLRFVVDRVEKHAKDAFPTEAVYGATDRPELRLVTCGGRFGTVRPGHYDDNWVIFASLAPGQP